MKLSGKKTGLVLSGGVVKAAAWHLGVVLALEEIGYSIKNQKSSPEDLKSPLLIDLIVGSSAGSLIASMLGAGFSAKEIIDLHLGFEKKSKPIGYSDIFRLNTNIFPKQEASEYLDVTKYPKLVSTLIHPFIKPTGLFTAEGLRKYLLKHMIKVDSFDKSKADLFFVTSQLDHPQKVIFTKKSLYPKKGSSDIEYRTCEKLSQAVAASMSLPPFFTPYGIRNPKTQEREYYIDGEIRDTLSTHIAEDQNCDVIISSWTHVPYRLQKKIGSLIKYGLPQIIVQGMYLMIEKKIQTDREQRRKIKSFEEKISSFLKEEGISSKVQKKIMSFIEEDFSYKKNSIYIDIFPDPDDSKFFFINSFSLKKEYLSYVIEAGYKKTKEVYPYSCSKT